MFEKTEIIADWVNKHSEELFRWAYHKTMDRDIAMDLVQDTFLAAVQAYEAFQFNSSVKTWLFGILNNKITDYYRSAQYKRSKLTGSMDEPEATTAINGYFDKAGSWNHFTPLDPHFEQVHLLDSLEFKQVMEDCVDELPHNWRLAILSKYYSEKTTEDICQELSVTTTNYWQMIHRAKLLLRKCIERNWIHD